MPNISSQQENLHRKFKHYGALHMEYRRKCIGLLPEIFKEKIYIKKGFESIFEYAAKLAGLSHEQVKRVLSLSGRFTDKPTLKSCLENGEVSVNKLAKIASVVTVENEGFWASQAKILPTRALETLARDEHRMAEKIPDESVMEMTRNHERESVQESIFENQDGLYESRHGNNFVHVNKMLELGLSSEVVNLLFELKQKGFDINQVLIELLKKREEAIAEEKEKIVAAMNEKNEQQKEQIAEEMGGEKCDEYAKNHAANESAKTKRTVIQDQKSPKPSRYIPVKIKRIIVQEHGTKCSIPTCSRPSEHIHHTQRFSLITHAAPQLVHNPHYLAPLCKEHHSIAHSIDVRYQGIKNARRSPTHSI